MAPRAAAVHQRGLGQPDCSTSCRPGFPGPGSGQDHVKSPLCSELGVSRWTLLTCLPVFPAPVWGMHHDFTAEGRAERAIAGGSAVLGCQHRLEVPGSAQPFPEPQDPPRTFDPCPPCSGRPDSDCWDHLLDSTSPKIHFSSAQNHDFWASGGGFSLSPESTLPEHILLQGLSSSHSRLDLPGQKPHLQTHLS